MELTLQLLKTELQVVKERRDQTFAHYHELHGIVKSLEQLVRYVERPAQEEKHADTEDIRAS